MTTVIGILFILVLFIAIPVVTIGAFLVASARRQQQAEDAEATPGADPDGPPAAAGEPTP